MRRVLLAAAALALAACEQTAIQGPLVVQREPTPALAPQNLAAFFDCVRESSATVVSAHRGRNNAMPIENALPSFGSTLSLAPAFLEVDVSRTRDGVLVLMHDDTVDRTTNGQGSTSAMTANEFAALRLTDHRGALMEFGPPTLREALDWAAGRTVLELDVKRGVSYEDVAREVRAAGAMDRVVFITYSLDGAARLAHVAPEAMLYTTIRNEGDLNTLEARGVELAHVVAWLGTDQFNEDLVEALAARGVESRFGMFDSGDHFDAAAHAGIQSLAVNDVAEAFRQVDRADGAEGYAAMQCVSAE